MGNANGNLQQAPPINGLLSLAVSSLGLQLAVLRQCDHLLAVLHTAWVTT